MVLVLKLFMVAFGRGLHCAVEVRYSIEHIRLSTWHAASRKLKDRQSVIQVDYCFTRTDPKFEMQTLLVATDLLTY